MGQDLSIRAVYAHLHGDNYWCSLVCALLVVMCSRGAARSQQRGSMCICVRPVPMSYSRDYETRTITCILLFAQ